LREGKEMESEDGKGLGSGLFATSRRKKLNRGFTASDRNFNVNVGRAALGRNFDVTTERDACKACSATWNFVTNSGTDIRAKVNHGKP
jgi:hypothetical protein